MRSARSLWVAAAVVGADMLLSWLAHRAFHHSPALALIWTPIEYAVRLTVACAILVVTDEMTRVIDESGLRWARLRAEAGWTLKAGAVVVGALLVVAALLFV